MHTIVRLCSDDLALYRSMNALFARAFDDAENYASSVPSDDWALEWLAAPSNIGFVALADGEVVGALAGYVLRKFEQERREIYIYDLAVDAAFRRRGVATALIDGVRDLAREIGVWTVFVQADTIPEDEPARRLYRKLASEEITALHFDIMP